MLKLFYGLLSAIQGKTRADGQALLATDTNQLFFDVGSQRYPVKDPTAGQSLGYANQTISLKDGSGTEISSVDLDPTLDFVMEVDLSDGHLYWGPLSEGE